MVLRFILSSALSSRCKNKQVGLSPTENQDQSLLLLPEMGTPSLHTRTATFADERAGWKGDGQLR